MNITLRTRFKWAGILLVCIVAAIIATEKLFARVVVFPGTCDTVPLGGVFIVWRQAEFGRCELIQTLFYKMYPKLSPLGRGSILDDPRTTDTEKIRQYDETIKEAKSAEAALLNDIQQRSVLRLPVNNVSLLFCKE